MKKIIVKDIEIHLRRKKVKNLNLSVHPPRGEVRLSVPYNTSDDTIREFVLSKASWIKKHQDRFKNQEIVGVNKYISGESHYFLGKKYILNIIYIDKNPAKVEIKDDAYINIYIKKEASIEKRAKLLKEWYRKELKLLIPPLIKKWEKIMKVSVNEFGVKQMKTRWGTCNIRDKRIWINLELAKKTPECLEYIVVHEMVHLLERDHNDKFKAHMDKFLPNWRSIQAKLNS
ncbi:MAG: M48 family metallopeptidase [Epulopiscium sp.]|nr:M48 family metallopeptidase [Candidatus Epulonipiscium sp.]